MAHGKDFSNPQCHLPTDGRSQLDMTRFCGHHLHALTHPLDQDITCTSAKGDLR